MKTEVAVIKVKEFEEVIKQSTLSDLTKAERIASGYAPFMIEAQEHANILKKLVKGNVEDVEKAKRIRLDIGKLCSRKDDQKKKDKELILVETRFIDALSNTVEGFARLTQQGAKDIEDHFENIEKERLAALQIERVDMIRLYVEDAENMSLSTMEDEVFEAYLATKKKQYEDRLEAEKLAEQQRIEAEKKAEAERVAEAKRLADEAEKNRIENERLKAEAEAREKAIELERQENAKKLAEQQRLANIEAAKIEAERKKEAEAREKLEAELQAKKEAEIKAEILEDERKEAAKKEAIKAAKAPVKTKMNVWVNSFNIPTIDIDNESSKEIIAKFESFKKWALTKVDEL